MKNILIILTILSSLSVNAAPNEKYYLDGKELTKIDAVKVLLNKPESDVVRCKRVELSDKVTIKVKKAR
jgi:hypothetical protein